MQRKIIRRSPQQILSLIQEQKKSGLSKIVFCKKHGIPVTTFYGWCGKRGRKRQESLACGNPFVPVEVIPQKSVSTGQVVVRCVGGMELELSDGVSAVWIREVLRGLL